MLYSDELAALSNQELLKILKSRKANAFSIIAILFLMVLFAIYQSINFGIGFYTFFPLLFTGIAINPWKSYRRAKEECTRRNIS
jgi:hypothetical protein